MTKTPPETYMAQALRLAERGRYGTAPNPVVGCVIVRAGEIVGSGWHERVGEAHAEVAALQAAGERAEGAEVFVTLEPCCHEGRTGPCTQALIDAGVASVTFAMQDPDPRVSGAGAAILAEQGVAVRSGLLETAACELNIGFIQRVTSGRPWVRLKLGMTLDGRIAAEDGSSQWITGEAARADVHRWRARSGAVLTGSGTVIKDDPRLDVRLDGNWPQPVRVVLDRRGRLPADARMLKDGAPVWVAGGEATLPAGAERLEMAGSDAGLVAVMQALGARGINELLVEAGSELSGALIEAGLVDEILIYMAPTLLGGNARAAFDLPGVRSLSDRVPLRIHEIRAVGDDWRIIARPEPRTEPAAENG